MTAVRTVHSCIQDATSQQTAKEGINLGFKPANDQRDEIYDWDSTGRSYKYYRFVHLINLTTVVYCLQEYHVLVPYVHQHNHLNECPGDVISAQFCNITVPVPYLMSEHVTVIKPTRPCKNGLKIRSTQSSASPAGTVSLNTHHPHETWRYLESLRLT